MESRKGKYSRREFIGKYIYSGSLVIGGGILLSCSALRSVAGDKASSEAEPTDITQDTLQSNPKSSTQNQNEPAQQKNPCDDMTGVSAEDLEKRKKLAYVNKTPIPDSHCSNCTLYLPAGKDKPCGGCMLFKGPVRQEGYCAYWAPISN